MTICKKRAALVTTKRGSVARGSGKTADIRLRQSAPDPDHDATSVHDAPWSSNVGTARRSMRMTRTHLLVLGLSGALVTGTFAPLLRAADEPIDYESISRIRAEGLNASSSQVMNTASWLTDVYGPRLTGSINIQKAAEWAAG